MWEEREDRWSEEDRRTPDWSCQIPYSGLGASIMIIMTRAVAL